MCQFIIAELDRQQAISEAYINLDTNITFAYQLQSFETSSKKSDLWLGFFIAKTSRIASRLPAFVSISLEYYGTIELDSTRTPRLNGCYFPRRIKTEYPVHRETISTYHQ